MSSDRLIFPPTQAAYGVAIDHGEGRISVWPEVWETRKGAALAMNASMALAEEEKRPKRATVIEVRIVPVSCVLPWPMEPEP